jgi:hypothetical protein
MGNTDTVKAIITNIETILSGAPHSLQKINIPGGVTETLPSFTANPVYYVLYDGEAPEYEYGQKPGYVESSFVVALIWLSGSVSAARDKSIEWFHAVRSALTVNALNAGTLATSKLVSRVTVEKPDVDMQPAETKIFYRTTVRYREDEMIPSGPITNQTWAQLKALADAAQLWPGQLYRITDFRTRHLIPNTTDYNEGAIDPLVVMAATVNSLYNEARSEAYPQDMICYELVDSSAAGGDLGRIYSRHDTIKNISVWEDWRAAKYRRWETAPGSGIYTILTDNGGAYIDRYMFNNSSIADTCHGIAIDATPTSGLCNNISGDHCSDIHLGPESINNTVGAYFTRFKSSGTFVQNVIGDYFRDNVVGHDFEYNTIGDYFQYNVAGNNFSTNAIGDYFNQNTIGNSFNLHTIGNDFENNVILMPISGLNIGDGVAFKILQPGLSTFEATIDITGMTSINLTNYAHVGIVHVISSNAAEAIDSITMSSAFPVDFRPAAGLDVQWTTTVCPLIDDTKLATYSLSQHTNGNNGEWIRFKKLAGRLGNYQDSNAIPYYQD